MLKVLHIIGGDLTKGAFRGAYWLHEGLLKINIDSQIIGFIPKNQTNERIKSVSNNLRGKFLTLLLRGINFILLKIYYKRKNHSFSFCFFGKDIKNHPFYKSANIIHVHWISNGVTSPRQISTFNKPTVITLRDMWSFTGGCHYTMGCEKYTLVCGKCPQLNSSIEFDLSKISQYNKKLNIKNNITFVGISEWITSCAKKSTILKKNRIETIYNCIDNSIFFPIETKLARHALGLELDSKIILIGAEKIDNYYKGWQLFLDAITFITTQEITILTFGNLNKPISLNNHIAIKNLGFLNDDISLRLAYNSANVFVAPSIQEAFGKTLVEAMFCGTPVVAFDATGPSSIIDHLETGYKAKPFSPEDLAKGIDYILQHQDPHLIREKCIKHANKKFSPEVIAENYKTLYEELVYN